MITYCEIVNEETSSSTPKLFFKANNPLNFIHRYENICWIRIGDSCWLQKRYEYGFFRQCFKSYVNNDVLLFENTEQVAKQCSLEIWKLPVRYNCCTYLFADLFKDVNDFTNAHPKEIVLIDLNRFYDFKEAQHEKLFAMLDSIFGSKLIDRPGTPRIALSLTLNKLWTAPGQVSFYPAGCATWKKAPE